MRNISLESGLYNLIKGGFGQAIGLAYDYNRSRVFVLDNGRHQLVSLHLNTSLANPVTKTEALISNLSGQQRGLAYDWITRKLYFLNRNRLTVCDDNGKLVKKK